MILSIVLALLLSRSGIVKKLVTSCLSISSSHPYNILIKIIHLSSFNIIVEIIYVFVLVNVNYYMVLHDGRSLRLTLLIFELNILWSHRAVMLLP